MRVFNVSYRIRLKKRDSLLNEKKSKNKMK